MNTLLKEILRTRRPTNNPAYCLAFTTDLLDACNISYIVDPFMNVIVDRGGSTCYTSHQDTVDNKLGTNVLSVAGDIVTVMGGGILGADCGSGMYIMVRMLLSDKPGLYIFFSTEEQGRIGSSKYAMPSTITKCISFDRKGTDNFITHQMGERGCSEAFADAFIAAFDLPYKKDPTGSFTDSYSFFNVVPECINMSVGYYNQHTKQESQDLAFLEKLVDACVALDWESLPVERDPTVSEWEDEDWDWYKGGKPYGKKTNHQFYSSYTPHITSIDDFVYEHPWVVADLLESYGVTLGDLIAHKAMIESIDTDTDTEELAA